MFVETVYIDMVFLVNFMMDLLLLSLLAGILRRDGRWRWLCAGALAGAVWACMAVAAVMPGWMELTGSIAAAMMMTALAFRERSIKAVFFMSVSLLGLSFFLSGMVNLVYYHTGAGYYMQRGGVPSYILFPVIGIGCAAVKKGAKLFWRYQGVQRQLCQVTLIYRNKRIGLTGFVDTGNQLYDPYQGRPVQIVWEEGLKGFLPQDQKFLYVPYHSVGKTDGLLKGFTADEIVIARSEQVFRQQKPFVALSPAPLNRQGRYQMLLHPDLLAGDQISGKALICQRSGYEHE